MYLTYFDSRGWESWDLAYAPAIPDGMPVLVDDDLLFEDEGGPRPTVRVNQWLRELPSSGAPAQSSWAVYARVLRDWMQFTASVGTSLFDDRQQLRSALGSYAVFRSSGPLEDRFEVSTWNQHVSVLSSFYRWAIAEGYADAEPFTYKQACAVYGDHVREQQINMAARRRPKPHVTIKYLEADFTAIFLNALAGLTPDGREDTFMGRELARNAAIGHLAFSSGMRRQEFTYLLTPEIPPLPARKGILPVPFPLPMGVTKGSKFRSTWISWDALARIHRYIDLDRRLAVEGSAWQPPASWGEPLVVTETDERGGRVNGHRVSWSTLGPQDRRRLVHVDGGSLMVAVRSGGGPFTAWATAFERTADRIRARFEPRFPHMNPHRARHSFAIFTLEKLVAGYYAAAAQLERDTDTNAALALYLAKTDPLMVLRDLLGHSSVLTTEVYLRRLDMTRVYRSAYEQAGQAAGLLSPAAWAEAEREADDEFTDSAEPWVDFEKGR